MVTLILLMLALAAGFIYAAGASARVRKALPGKPSREAALLAAAVHIGDKCGHSTHLAAEKAEAGAMLLLNASSAATALATARLAARAQERERRKQALY